MKNIKKLVLVSLMSCIGFIKANENSFDDVAVDSRIAYQQRHIKEAVADYQLIRDTFNQARAHNEAVDSEGYNAMKDELKRAELAMLEASDAGLVLKSCRKSGYGPKETTFVPKGHGRYKQLEKELETPSQEWSWTSRLGNSIDNWLYNSKLWLSGLKNSLGARVYTPNNDISRYSDRFDSEEKAAQQAATPNKQWFEMSEEEQQRANALDMSIRAARDADYYIKHPEELKKIVNGRK